MVGRWDERRVFGALKSRFAGRPRLAAEPRAACPDREFLRRSFVEPARGASPRCGVRLTREMMVRHLWHEHGLLLESGRVRSPQRTVEELKAEREQALDACR